MAKKNREEGGRPFAAVLVRDGKVIGRGVNHMLKNHDPSSHGEMEAIRDAAQKLKTTNLEGSTIYASGQPCPMCVGAILMTNIKSVFYAYDNTAAERYGLSTASVYQKMGLVKEKLPITFEQLDVGIKIDDVYKGFKK